MVRHWLMTATLALSVGVSASDIDAEPSAAHPSAPDAPSILQGKSSADTVTLSFLQAPIGEVFAMLSRIGRINIVLSKNVSGTVSANIFDSDIMDAINIVAEAGGYTVIPYGNSFLIDSPGTEGAGRSKQKTEIKIFKAQYSEPSQLSELLSKHLTEKGKVNILENRNLVVVEDTPEKVREIETLMASVDVQPRQILVEAKILEITLTDEDQFGITWDAPFGESLIGKDLNLYGNAVLASTGLTFNHYTGAIATVLTALDKKGRVRTLSTPKLIMTENQEAEVLVGNRLGFKVTTTTNQVTTESVEFLETGIILKVKAVVDNQDRILLELHPEVSTGSIANNIPSEATTEVTTQILADSGQKVFIGGLIKKSDTNTKTGIPILGDLPLVGGLFSQNSDIQTNTETVVIITPHLVEAETTTDPERSVEHVDRHDSLLRLKMTRSIGDYYHEEDEDYDLEQQWGSDTLDVDPNYGFEPLTISDRLRYERRDYWEPQSPPDPPVSDTPARTPPTVTEPKEYLEPAFPRTPSPESRSRDGRDEQVDAPSSPPSGQPEEPKRTGGWSWSDLFKPFASSSQPSAPDNDQDNRRSLWCSGVECNRRD
ncbi:MAG: hypothetical protein HQL50_07210 [Magnetococcales bacterium]|nr:hypothetical protein [Magnetococcales bacterium]